MSNLIFKKDISNNLLFEFLSNYCSLENEYYIFDKIIFKQYEYNNLVKDFLDSLRENYKESKRYYLDRPITYNNILTIFRQICKNNNIPYYSKIKYDKNKCYIIYFIKNIAL